MKVKVNPYHFVQLPNQEVYCFAPNTALMVNNRPVAEILKRLLVHMNQVIDSEILLSFDKFSFDPKNKLRRFLFEETGIVCEHHESKKPFNGIFIHTDSEHFREFITKNFSSFVCDEPYENENRRRFHLVFLENYAEEVMRKVYQQAEQNQEAIFANYLLEDSLFIDPPYEFNCGLPCHWCHLGHLKGKKAEEATGQSNSFFELFHFVMGKKLPLPLAQPLTPLKRNLVFWKLGKLVEHALGLSETQRAIEEWGMQTRIDLRTGTGISDVSLHWDLCDCISGGTSRQ